MAINNSSNTGANIPFASVAQAQNGTSQTTVISPFTLKAVIDPIQQTIDAIEGINDLQAFTSEVNAIEASAGINTDGTLPNYANQNVIGNGDSHHTAIGKLDAKAALLQSEIDTTQSAAGLNPTGNYVANTLSTYLVDAVSLKDADNKLDVAIAGVRGDLTQEILNRTNADSALQIELNQTQAGAGLNVDGTYTAPVGSNYLGSTTTIKGALVTLDTQMVNRANDIAGLTVEINNVETAVGLETNGTKTDFGSTNVVTGNSSFKAAIEALDTYVGDMESGNGVIALQSEVDKIETAIGVMIDSDGDFVTPDSSRNYIDTATSISNAIEILDTELKSVDDDLQGYKATPLSLDDNQIVFTTDGDTFAGSDNLRFKNLNALPAKTLVIGEEPNFVTTIKTNITTAETFAGTLAAFTAQNKSSDNMASVNIYLKDNSATEVAGYSVMGMNGENYNSGVDYITERQKGLYIANTDGDIAFVANYNGNARGGNIHFGYEDATKAISINNAGAISTSTTFNSTNQTFTFNNGNENAVLVSKGTNAPVEWVDKSTYLSDIQTEVNSIETAVGLGADGTKTDFASDYVITANSSFKAAIEALDTYVSGLESGNGTIALQSELNDTQTGAGLNTDGSYTPPEGSEFLGSTTSLKSALAALDTNLATITNDFDAHHLHSNSYYVNDGVSDLQTVINEIGADQGNVIYMSAGSYGGDDVSITNSVNLNIIGPERSQGAAICELVERGMSISGVTTTRITINNLQIEGDFTINGTEGRHYFKNVQFLGNVLITNGTTNFITFDQCDFAGSITIASTVSAQVYFSRCGLGGNLVTSQRTGGSAPLLTILTECYGLNNSQSQLTSNVALVGRTGYANNTVVNNASSSNYTYNLLTGAQTSFSGAYSELRGKPTIPSASTDLSDSANLLRTTDVGTTAGKLVALDGAAKIDISLLPATVLTDVHAVADETERLAIPDLVEGDVAIQADDGSAWIYDGTQWLSMSVGTGAITTVNGKSGATITLYTDDISEDGSPTNLWHTADRARTAAVVNSTSGSETNQAPSVSAIKSYITTALSDYELKTDNEASDILTKIKTVDGPGSGLDADLFDGLNSDVFVQTTGAQSIAGVKTFTDAPIVPNQTALNSSTKAANTKYVDDAVKVVTDTQGSTGILIYKGSYDASTNTPVLTSAKKGYFYDISASGTLAGVSLATTDQIVFVSDVVGGVIASTDFIKVDNTETPLSAGSLPVVKIGSATQLQQGIYYVVDSNSSFSVAVPTKAMVSGKTGGIFYIRHRGTGTVTVTCTGVAGGEFLWYPGDNLTPGATFGVKSIALTRAGEYKFVATQIDGAASAFVQWDVTVNNHKALRTTDDLTEGSTNKYFSNTLARAAFTAGTGISISTGTISSTITQYTDEMAQDAAGSALVAGSHSGISFTYGSTQDTANRIDATVQIEGSALAFPAVALSTPPTATTLAAGNYYYSSTNTQGSAFSVTLPTTGRSGDVVYIHNFGSNTINTAVLAYYYNGSYSGTGQTFSMTTNDLFVFTRLSTGNVWMISVRPSVNLRSTTNITEGSNLYYTDERARDAAGTALANGVHTTGLSFANDDANDRINATLSLAGFSINALSDVDTTAVAPADGDVLTWNATGSQWKPAAPTGGGGGSFTVDDGNRFVSSNQSIDVTDALGLYIATAACTLTLPAPSSSYQGKQIIVKSYTTGAVTISSASGSQIIYDSASASASITHPAGNPGFSTTLICVEGASSTFYWVAI